MLHSMTNWLAKRASLTPDRIAVKTEQTEWTFAELNDRALQTARKLAAFGIDRGDHVAVLLSNRIEYVELIHALEYLGAVMVLFNIRLTPHELSWQLENSQAKLLICDPGHAEKGADAVRLALEAGASVTRITLEELLAGPESDIEIETEIDLDDIHTIMYTSGTTGYPKGVLLSYGNHWWSAIGSCLNLGLQSEDKWLACVPLFHVSGLSILMRSVIYGMTVILHESFDPSRVNQAIQTQGITMISVVSAMLVRILEDLGDDRYPAGFRCMLLGGGPAPKPLLEACREKQIPVFQTYGMTETGSQIVTLSSEYMLEKLGSAGKPLFPAELRIESEGRLLQPGEVGEIVVKGPNVTRGYFRREDATAKAIQNGWLYTGDLGYVDQDGFLFVVDRRSDLILSGGENIYPAEIEEVLLSHPAVAEAGVTGMPDEKWGQVPVAFVKIRDGFQPDDAELLDYLRQKLARYKLPVAIYRVQELPRNASNKLLRRKLLDLLPH